MINLKRHACIREAFYAYLSIIQWIMIMIVLCRLLQGCVRLVKKKYINGSQSGRNKTENNIITQEKGQTQGFLPEITKSLQGYVPVKS